MIEVSATKERAKALAPCNKKPHSGSFTVSPGSQSSGELSCFSSEPGRDPGDFTKQSAGFGKRSPFQNNLKMDWKSKCWIWLTLRRFHLSCQLWSNTSFHKNQEKCFYWQYSWRRGKHPIACVPFWTSLLPGSTSTCSVYCRLLWPPHVRSLGAANIKGNFSFQKNP